MMLFHEGRAETTDGGIQYTTLFHHVEWTPKSRECLDLLFILLEYLPLRPSGIDERFCSGCFGFCRCHSGLIFLSSALSKPMMTSSNIS